VNRRILALAWSCCLVLFIQSAAAQLVYFDETPRGLYTFNPITGASTLRCVVPGTERFFGMDRRASDGVIFGTDLFGSGLWTINPNTCATTRIGTLTPAIDRPEGIAFHPITGQLYVSSVDGDLYKVNSANAATTLVGHSGLTIRGHSFSPDGSRFLAIHESTGDLYSVNPLNAVATRIGPSIPSSTPEDMTFTADGQLFGTAFSGELYGINPATGAATLLGTSPDPGGLLSLVAIPEPGALWSASLLLSLLRRRRRVP